MSNNFYKFNIRFIVLCLGLIHLSMNGLLIGRVNSHYNMVIVLFGSLLLSIGYGYYKQDKQSIARVLLASFGLYLLFGLVAYFTFDKAGDSRWYHQGLVWEIYNGWNPFYDYSIKLISATKGDSRHYFNLVYPAGNAMLILPFVLISKSIQFGKIVNLLWLLALYCGVSLYLQRFKFSKFNYNLARFYLVASPYALTMTLSYYLDGNIYAGIILFFIGILLIFDEKNKIFGNKEIYIGLLLIGFYIVNLKPTVIVVLLCGLFCFLVLYPRKVLRLNWLWLLAFSFLVVVALYHPYLQNILMSPKVMVFDNSAITLPNLKIFNMSVTNSIEYLLIGILSPVILSNSSEVYYFDWHKYSGAVDASAGAYGIFFGLMCVLISFLLLNRLKKNKCSYVMYSYELFFWVLVSIISTLVICLSSFGTIMLVRWCLLIWIFPLFGYLYLVNIGVNFSRYHKIICVVLLLNMAPLLIVPNGVTFFRTYKYLNMKNYCNQNQCIADISANSGNWFYLSLRWQLQQDVPNIVLGICENHKIIWEDSKINHNQYNLICDK